MSGNSNKDVPGGGYQPVPGYVPPGGSQAEEILRRQREAERRKRADDLARLQEAQNRQLERERSDRERREREARARSQRARRSTSPAPRSTKRTSTKPKPTKKTSKRQAKSGDWSTGWAVLGFLVGAGLVLGQMPEGEEAGLGTLVAGGVGGYVAGRYYKAVVALLVILFVLWLLSEGG